MPTVPPSSRVHLAVDMGRRTARRVLARPDVPRDASPELVELILRQVKAENDFIVHLGTYAGATVFFLAGNFVTTRFLPPWSLFPILGWGLGIWMQAASLWSKRRQHREQRNDLERTQAGKVGKGADADSVAGLREKLLQTAEDARATVRSASPQAASMIAQGEARALRVVAWLSDADREVAAIATERAYRKEIAVKLSDPRYKKDRERLARMLEELDRRDAALGALERVAAERRARLESFLLALEGAKMARPETHLLESVTAPLYERVELLEAAASPSTSGPEASASRIEEEVRLARELQRSILPDRAPDVPGLSVAQVYRPSSEVGGDFYDFYARGGGRLLLALGDASGHGIDSSMIGSMAKSALYLQVSSGKSLTEALGELNRMMADTLGRRRLMTMVLLEIDAESHKVSWVNAGQVFPMVVRRGTVVELEQPGYPLGVRRNVTYAAREMTLELGDLLVLVTDGVPEALSGSGEPYGFERLSDCLSRLPASSTATMAIETVAADLSRYLGPMPPQDDVTMIAVRVTS